MLISDIIEPSLEEDWKRFRDLASTAVVAGGIGMAGVNAAKEVNSILNPPTPYSVTIPVTDAPGYPRVASARTTSPKRTRRSEARSEAHQRLSDERLLALTIWGEARGHGEEGMRAVGHVIMNRARADRRSFGHGIRGVVLKRRQFSCWNQGDPNREAMLNIAELPRDSGDRAAWNKAQRIARQILSGQDRDPTRGALFYHTTAVRPSWATDMHPVRRIANHIFYA